MNQLIVQQFSYLIKQKKLELSVLKQNKDSPPDRKKITEYNFKISNLSKALIKIQDYPDIINRGEDLKDIKGIGKGIISRINQIIDNGKLDELKEQSLTFTNQNVIESLETITGI